MSAWFGEAPYGYAKVIQAALDEDLCLGDPSAAILGEAPFAWFIEAQATGVASGVQIAAEVLSADNVQVQDGEIVHPGKLIVSGSGPASFVLGRERTSLNFLTSMSGTATLTAQFVEAVKGTGTRIVDTRKTLPGLRNIQKYAVRCGGGHNHRMNLGDGVMLKDNHIAACGSIKQAIAGARARSPHTLRIEVECETIEQVNESVASGADIVMLDNMDLGTMTKAVAAHKGKVIFEASGGVSLERVRQIAETGVDVISIGALTHSAPALSFHLEATSL